MAGQALTDERSHALGGRRGHTLSGECGEVFGLLG
jgi:hypothetical protein